jgi:hypothetical protein
MAHHILGQSRTQTTLLPEVLDDFVWIITHVNHPVSNQVGVK